MHFEKTLAADMAHAVKELRQDPDRFSHQKTALQSWMAVPADATVLQTVFVELQVTNEEHNDWGVGPATLAFADTGC